jgi:ABC-type branched-subunit amino acid transport system ATPase component
VTADDTPASATAEGEPALLDVDGVVKRFGGLVAVDGATFEVADGSITGLIGPNGAGKSTLFNCITGLYEPTDGDVYFRDERITARQPHEIARLGIARSFQESDVFLGMTVRENVAVAAQAADDRRRSMRMPASRLTSIDDRVDSALADVGMADQADKPAGDLSHGDRRKLEVALTAVNNPDLLLLDELTSGMGKQDSIETVGTIRQLADDRSITIVMIEHDIGVVMNNSDVITVLHNGRVIARGSPESVQADEAVRQAYLGVEDAAVTDTASGRAGQTGDDGATERPAPAHRGGGSDPLLSLEDVHASYGQSQVLQGLSMSVGEGEIVSLVGRNGVGKTTTLRTIAGVLEPSLGAVRFDGRNLQGLSDFQRARAGIGYVPEDRQVFPELTVRENLKMGQIGAGRGVFGLEEVFERFPRLDGRRSQLGAQLSGGEQQMLAIARALVGPTELLLLDEPTEGLAPQIVSEVVDIVGDIRREEGISVLLVEQNVQAAMDVADRHNVLHDGTIVFEGTTGQLAAAEDVVDRYLGVGAELRAD